MMLINVAATKRFIRDQFKSLRAENCQITRIPEETIDKLNAEMRNRITMEVRRHTGGKTFRIL